jgi:hypothetical protein
MEEWEYFLKALLQSQSIKVFSEAMELVVLTQVQLHSRQPFQIVMLAKMVDMGFGSTTAIKQRFHHLMQMKMQVMGFMLMASLQLKSCQPLRILIPEVGLCLTMWLMRLQMEISLVTILAMGSFSLKHVNMEFLQTMYREATRQDEQWLLAQACQTYS